MAIDADLRYWPLVYARFDGKQTVEEVDDYFRRMGEVHARKKPWVSVVFMNDYARDPRVLRRVAQGMKDTEEAVRQYCLGVAMVSASSGFRFVLSSVFLIQPMVCPYVVVGTLDEAHKYVAQKAAERGLTIPPRAAPAWPL
jgi:hypothetical protein